MIWEAEELSKQSAPRRTSDPASIHNHGFSNISHIILPVQRLLAWVWGHEYKGVVFIMVVTIWKPFCHDCLWKTIYYHLYISFKTCGYVYKSNLTSMSTGNCTKHVFECIHTMCQLANTIIFSRYTFLAGLHEIFIVVNISIYMKEPKSLWVPYHHCITPQPKHVFNWAHSGL